MASRWCSPDTGISATDPPRRICRRIDQTQMKLKPCRSLKQIPLACLCLFAFLFAFRAPAIADPLADAARAYRAGDYAKAEKLLSPLARHGDARAQSVLGHLYYDGTGVPRDHKKAAKWFGRAAAQKEVRAQYALGTMYADGDGVRKDYREAAKWYRAAAEQGDAAAQSELGRMYKAGRGVPENAAEAVKWCHLAAQQGDTDAQIELAEMLWFGEGAAQDRVRANMWLYVAAGHIAGSDKQKRIAKILDNEAQSLSPGQTADAQALAKKCAADQFKGC
jgi:TPR repeat protein